MYFAIDIAHGLVHIDFVSTSCEPEAQQLRLGGSVDAKKLQQLAEKQQQRLARPLLDIFWMLLLLLLLLLLMLMLMLMLLLAKRLGTMDLRSCDCFLKISQPSAMNDLPTMFQGEIETWSVDGRGKSDTTELVLASQVSSKHWQADLTTPTSVMKCEYNVYFLGSLDQIFVVDLISEFPFI